MSKSSGPLPFLEFNGNEIANAARTVEYVRRGLGTPNQFVGPGALCDVLYRQLGGTCGVPDTFASPASDPAPWYDATRPESEQFLGLFLTDIKGYDSTIQRDVVPRAYGLGGGTLKSERYAPRELKFTGYLFSSSAAGAEFGLEWLTDILSSKGSGANCDTCGTGAVRILLSCPPDDCSDDQRGEWYCYEGALTLGPLEADDTLTCRDAVLVEFTLTAGNPFLYKAPEVCRAPTDLALVSYDCTEFIAHSDSTVAIVGAGHVSFQVPSGLPYTPGDHVVASASVASMTGTVFSYSGTTLVINVTSHLGSGSHSAWAITDSDYSEDFCDWFNSSPTAPICCTFIVPKMGTLGLIVTIDASAEVADVSDLWIKTYATSGCTGTAVQSVLVDHIPAGSKLVIDGAKHVATLIDATGAESDGIAYLVIPAGSLFEWLEVGPGCDYAECICVGTSEPCSGGSATLVSIDTQYRRL